MTKNEVIETIRTWMQTIDDEYDIEEQGRVYGLMEALELIKQIEPEQKWIPVSERLPEDLEVILFSTKTDGVFEGRYFADDTDIQWYSFRDETFVRNNVVTAWMPLPKEYEPQESEVEE